MTAVSRFMPRTVSPALCQSHSKRELLKHRNAAGQWQISRRTASSARSMGNRFNDIDFLAATI
jgi:hypothetical protein